MNNTFGRLTVISEPFREGGRTKVLVRCECGTEKIVRVGDLKSGHTASCGCYQREQTIGRHTTHGQTSTRLYKIWDDMKKRCTHSRYKHYHGRGITVCEDWQTFEPFYQWSIENGYRDNLTIDRVNVNDNYEPGNCRWATRKVQNENQRKQRNNTSGFIGVHLYKGRFVAQAKRDGRRVHLGRFDTAEEAAHVRDAFVQEHYESPTLNFPSEEQTCEPS
jgi:hypothetical protein